MKTVVSNKGQAAIFTIVGIVIVMIVILMIYLFSSRNIATEVKKTVSFENVVDTARSFVKECSEETLKEAIKKVSSQGGYYSFPVEKKVETPFGPTVLIYDKKGMLITKDGLKKELQAYMKDYASRVCDFSKLKDVKIKAGAYQSTILLSASKVALEQRWPIEVSRGESTTTIESASIAYDSRLDSIHTFLMSLVESFADSMHPISINIPEGIDMRIIEQNSYDVYVITDKRSLINEKPLRFLFAVKL